MASLIANAALFPPLTGGLLFLLTKAPENLRQPALQQLQQVLSGENIARLITGLKVLLGTGFISHMNALLNELSHNNFRSANKQEWNWPNEIAVITGTSSGFGKLLAQDLAAKGIRVAALDVSDPNPELENNKKITHYKCDVTDPEAVKAVAKRIQEEIGHPSILINNAGIGQGHSILETPPEYAKKIFNINVISHYWMAQAFVPHMIKVKKGHVITMASIASFVVPAGMVDYAATKAAVYTFHEGLACELRTFHNAPEIKMTLVHPGWANTPLIASHVEEIRKAQPVVEPEVITDKVVKQIMDCQSGQLIIMKGGRLISTLKSWPFWIVRLIQNSSANISKSSVVNENAK